uniref:Tyrosinase copper-binding domain-containing protein n=1 Tax=Biomphalaria glabrata TaxID=6526 RepID=A0A2C9L419_BIOGL
MCGHLLIYVLVIMINIEYISSKMWECSMPVELQECYNRAGKTDVRDFVGSLYNWLCEQHTMQDDPDRKPDIDSRAVQYLMDLSRQAADTGSTREKRQSSSGPCVRKEYRMLTLEERRRYHDAINTLKNDTSVSPNKYDAIALIHRGVTNLIAHGGPGFMGWHRYFIRMYELALRLVNPLVCLVFWDSSLDYSLSNPVLSSIWTSEYMGTPRGPVVNGPFALWRTPDGSQLIRNAGLDGDLYTPGVINDLVTRSRYEDLFPASGGTQRYDFELHHGAVHVYIGGTMNRLDTAAFDPMFFMHHCFVDYLFQRVRAFMRSRGRDPTIYPRLIRSLPRHEAGAPTGFGNTTQADGYSVSLENTAIYEAVPSCSATSPSCGNRSLVCRNNRCVPTTAPIRLRRAVEDFDQALECDKSSRDDLAVQNDYCINKTCDAENWVYIPVNIFTERPPKFVEYDSYPVRRGRVDKSLDIYSPKANNQTKAMITDRMGDPKTYSRCKKDTPTGQVFLYSQGLNYIGRYKESAIVDQRLSVSISVGFVGVRKPTEGLKGLTKALIRAHDSCGRVCRVTCRNGSTGAFRPCSGVVCISNEKPLMYGNDYDEATTNVFGYKSIREYPRFMTENVFISFFCDYPKNYPFAKNVTISSKKV